jgi:hypothetical protein
MNSNDEAISTGRWRLKMASPKKSSSWQETRRALSSKSKTELLNLIRDLYALNSENQDLVRAQALAPKTSPSHTVTAKDVRRGTTFEVVVKGKGPKAEPKSKTSQVVPKIRRLAKLAGELREGNHFNITRLTSLKSLCEDADATMHFAVHVAKQTYQTMQKRKRPSYIEPEKWDAYKALVAKALEYMEAYVEDLTHETQRALWTVQSEVKNVQNTYKKNQWGPVRIIQSGDVLLIEYALSCLLQPNASSDWGYRIARQYAECSNSRYGTGLMPESAPMVEDIADFWCQFHMGKPLQEWLGTS